MAITSTHARLFQSLPLPRDGSLLEIGEANWFGDIDPAEFGLQPQNDLFAIAKEFYAKTFSPSFTRAIDLDPSRPGASKLDLNCYVPWVDDSSVEPFDLVINHGTAEHIFNIGQVFRTIHDLCATGGLMIHDAPFTGWVDHGFYSLHPTLFYDLANANCYEVTKMAIHSHQRKLIIPVQGRGHIGKLAAMHEIPANSMLFVCFRKIAGREFRVPMQGAYSGTAQFMVPA